MRRLVHFPFLDARHISCYRSTNPLLVTFLTSIMLLLLILPLCRSIHSVTMRSIGGMLPNTIKAFLEIVQYGNTIRNAMCFWNRSMILHYLANILLAYIKSSYSSSKCGTTARSFLMCCLVLGMIFSSNLIISLALLATINVCDPKLAFGSKYIPKRIKLKRNYVLSLDLDL